MAEEFEFGGYATRSNILCTDGLIIGENAFSHNDGKQVPLYYQHQHNDIENVLGHVVLENRPDGVYAYGSFNDTPRGKEAREMVKHGDLNSLSIYANRLQKNKNVVVHGDIKEVSLVMAGANQGAYIDYRSFSHSDGEEDDFSEGIVYMNSKLDIFSNYMQHNENMGGTLMNYTDEKIDAIIETMTDEQKDLLFDMAGINDDFDDDDDMEHSDSLSHADSDKTVGDVLNSLSEEQQLAVAYLLEQIMTASKDSAEHSEIGEDYMKTNVFDQYGITNSGETLVHAEEVKGAILADIKKYGSLKESYLAHEEEVKEIGDTLAHAADVVVGDGQGTYGINNIDWLFPDARNITNTPEFIKRQDAWVSSVMSGTNHTPFSRIKSMYADITADEARAKGYTKGHLKTEEVFGLLKRITTPTTVYKKQKIDRDDVLDIVDFDIVLWLRAEMRIMLDEEIARAILIGDGRGVNSDDKINEQNIRPIYTDDVLFTIHQKYNVPSNATDEAKAKEFIKQCVKSRKDYRGSGNPTLYTTVDLLTDMLLIEDGLGRRLYSTVNDLMAALRVSAIETVPQFESISRTESNDTYYLDGMIVNLRDYTVGSDKGGAVSMFDDFDIDYNQQKYLLETRCSGALTRPKSAIVVEHKVVAASGSGT